MAERTTERIYDAAEAAEILGVCEVTVRRYCFNLDLGQKVRGRWRIGAAELREFQEIQPKRGRPPGKSRGKSGPAEPKITQPVAG